MMRYFRVLYNFDAQDSVELTVKKGEIVIATSEADIVDGWIKVEIQHDSSRRGFVPLNYLRETPKEVIKEIIAPVKRENSIKRENSTKREIQQEESPVTFTAAALDYGDKLQNLYQTRESSRPLEEMSGTRRSRQLSSTLNESQYQQQQQQQQQQTQHQQSQLQQLEVQSLSNSAMNTTNSAGRSLLNDPNGVIEAFMKNELHFKQLVRQRQDALAQMRLTLTGAISDVSACKERNATLARKLRDLDQSIEKERKRWKERIEEEKAYISRTISADETESTATSSKNY